MLRTAACLAFCALALPAQQRVWLDADTANEIDDLYAITRAFAAPGWQFVALSSAQWKQSPLAEGNTLEASQLLNEALLELLGRGDLPHPRGSLVPVYWWGRDRIAYSGAAYHLMLEARQTPAGQKLNVVALGALTNVASALMMDPSIASRLRLFWLGAEVTDGVWNKNEFNCLNDIHALNEVLNAAGLELNVMPANVARALTFDYASTAARLRGKGRLGDFLLARWDRHGPGAATWTMWDLAAVQWMLEPEQVRSAVLPAPPENNRRQVRVALSIDADAMRASFWRAFEQIAARPSQPGR
jgi:inosine-uridine nucleoside N-ribohydrolase